MRALVLHGAYDFQYEERPIPDPSTDKVLVKIDAISICGSDIHAIRGNQPLFSFPRVIGHEVAATVIRGCCDSGLEPGDKVCLMPCISCGHCIACRSGKGNCCSALKLYGVHVDGGLQEYLAVPPKNLLRLPQDTKPEEASVIEPLTIGMHAVGKLRLQPGENILIVGAGPIGMTCAVAAESWGATVYLADTSSARRKFAEERFGYPVLDPSAEDYLERLNAITGGEGFHAVADTTANRQSMERCGELIGQGGRIVFIGMYRNMLEADEFKLHMKEPSLFFSRNSTDQDYRRVVELWSQGKINPANFITHTVAFGDAAEAVTEWAKSAGTLFKGIVKFG